ncbi:MAG: FCD domain-containing protein [Actinomycetaceae bacterium]|nr:FCD domain-containing protein [Actinomycetaceae bacterium]MDY5854569.1 FCD domain-containing protein [Arcanobacterium sp.]
MSWRTLFEQHISYCADHDLRNRKQNQGKHRIDAYAQASEKSDIDAALEADIAFHDVILAATNNPLIPVMMSSLASAVARSRRATTALAEVRERAAHHHRLVFEAIKAGDATGAKQAMRAHMTQTKNDILLVTKPDSSPDTAAE